MKILERKEIDQTMQQGSKAFMAGQDESHNPYSAYNDLGRLWLRGFTNAKFGHGYSEKKKA